MGRRPLVLWAGAVAIALGMSATQATAEPAIYTDLSQLEAAAMKEGTLNAYVPNEYADFFVQGFEKKYPWATVNFTGMEPAQTIAKWTLELNSNVNTLDVAAIYIAQVSQFKNKGALAQIGVPNDAKVAAALQDPDHYFHAMISFPYTIMHNTKLVDAGPKTLQELADPAWKGKIAFDNPALGGSTALVLSSLRKTMNEDEWVAFLNKLKANDPYLTESASTSYATVLRGDRAVCICSYHDYTAQAEGAPVGVDFYNQDSTGIVTQVGAMVAAAKAPHPAMAALFLNYILSDEAQLGVLASGRAPVVAVPGSEKSGIPANVHIASPVEDLSVYMSDPAESNAIYKKIFSN